MPIEDLFGPIISDSFHISNENNNRFYIDLNDNFCFKETGQCSKMVFQPGKIISCDQLILEKLWVYNLPKFILQKNYDWDICRVDIQNQVPIIPSWAKIRDPDSHTGCVQTVKLLYRIEDWNSITANEFSLECAKRIINLSKTIRKEADPDYIEAIEIVNSLIEILKNINSSRKERENDIWADYLELLRLFWRSNHPLNDRIDSITKRIENKSDDFPPGMYIKKMFLSMLTSYGSYSPGEVAFNARVVYAWINKQGIFGKENDDLFIDNQVKELHTQTDIFRKLVHEE